MVWIIDVYNIIMFRFVMGVQLFDVFIAIKTYPL